MGIKIITDSTADFCEEIGSQVTVVPLTLKFGNKEYLDGVDTVSYTHLTLPTTPYV